MLDWPQSMTLPQKGEVLQVEEDENTAEHGAGWGIQLDDDQVESN